jgi:hypothetical protein
MGFLIPGSLVRVQPGVLVFKALPYGGAVLVTSLVFPDCQIGQSSLVRNVEPEQCFDAGMPHELWKAGSVWSSSKPAGWFHFGIIGSVDLSFPPGSQPAGVLAVACENAVVCLSSAGDRDEHQTP